MQFCIKNYINNLKNKGLHYENNKLFIIYQNFEK